MSVPVGVARTRNIGSGSAGPFPFNFVLYDATHLKVVKTGLDGVETLLALTAGYAVTLASDFSSASVTVMIPLAGTGLDNGTSEILTITRDPPIQQLTEWPRNDPFPSRTHERAADLAVMMIGRLNEKLGRAPLLSEGSAFSNIVLPDPVGGQLLGWNGAGTNLENKTLTGTGLAVFPVSSVNNDIVLFNGSGGQSFKGANLNIGILRVYEWSKYK